MEREGQAKTRDGRTLAFFERGAPDGMPVLVCHGTPGSRLTRHPDPVMYEHHGVRMVPYDRPGYGRSDPHLGRSVADAAADIAAIADELGLERFAVVGGSGGAPHALACGALLGDRVVRVGALVTRRPTLPTSISSPTSPTSTSRSSAPRSRGVKRSRRTSRAMWTSCSATRTS